MIPSLVEQQQMRSMSSSAEIWDVSALPLPSRAVLPAPRPSAPATSEAESLISYLKRLSATLVVPVRRLLSKPAPRSHTSVTIGGREIVDRVAYLEPTTLIGATDRAQEWAGRLASLTGYAQVSALAFGTWSKIMPTRAFVRTTLAYCQECFAEWAALAEPLREPLAWSIADACLRHKAPLADACSHCMRTISGCDMFKAPVGVCPYCAQLLATGHSARSRAEVSDLHLARVAGDLVANAAEGKRVEPDRIRGLIEIARDACGSANALARTMQVGRSLISNWRNAQVNPSFVELVRIAQIAGVALVPYLLGYGEVPDDHRDSLIPRRRQSQNGIPWKEVERLLAAALDSPDAPALGAVLAATGRDPKGVAARYPLQTAVIKDKASTARAARRAQRLDSIQDQVRRAVVALRASGRRPSRRALEAELAGWSVREPAVREAWLKAVRDHPGP